MTTTTSTTMYTLICPSGKKRGESIETPYTLAEAGQRLSDLVARDDVKGEFARDLASAWRRFGERLSPARAWWLQKLLIEAEGGGSPAEQRSGADMSAVLQVMDAERGGKQTSKLRYDLPGGEELVLALKGPRAKRPGEVYLTNGLSFGDPDGRWFGRIDAGGKLIAGRDMDADVMHALERIGERADRPDESDPAPLASPERKRQDIDLQAPESERPAAAPIDRGRPRSGVQHRLSDIAKGKTWAEAEVKPDKPKPKPKPRPRPAQRRSKPKKDETIDDIFGGAGL